MVNWIWSPHILTGPSDASGEAHESGGPVGVNRDMQVLGSVEGVRATARRRRTARMYRASVQILIIAIVASLPLALVLAIWHGLQSHGIPFDLGFLWNRAGTEISEGYTLA